MKKIDGKEFRALAEYAVDQIAKFLDDHPDTEFYPMLRITTNLGIVAVGIETKKNEEEDED